MDWRDIADVLDVCEVQNAASGIEKNLKCWETNKASLVNLLSKHPNWNEDALAIITKETVECEVDDREIESAIAHLVRAVRNAGASGTSDVLGRVLYAMHDSRTLQEPTVSGIINQSPHCAHGEPGMKTTRWIAATLRKAGIADSATWVWKAYQQLADLMCAKTQTYWLIVSVNPADYLTMSWGDNWASCHIINPDLARSSTNSHNGCYKAGCLSYMNDECSIVTYTVAKLPEDLRELPTTPRHTRQMFFVNQDAKVVLQSRFYPYSADESMTLARRKSMQAIMAQCWEIENNWRVSENAADDYFVTDDYGLHYHDYGYYTAWALTPSAPMETPFEPQYAIIGNAAYCLVCGDQLYEAERVVCEDCDDIQCCADCGTEHRRDDMYEIDGEWYCDDCCFYCEHHADMEPAGVGYEDVVGCGYVCRDALAENEYYFYDSYEQRWYLRDDLTDPILTSDGESFRNAENAKKALYVQCDECGDWVYYQNACRWENGKRYCLECAKPGVNEICKHCGKIYNVIYDTASPHCGVVIEEENTNV